MASLGAADRLARRTLQQLADFEGRRSHLALLLTRTAGASRAITSATLLFAVIVAREEGADVATLAFLALLATGVMGSAERLTGAAHARNAARRAATRLDLAGTGNLAQPAARASFDERGLSIAYRLPATLTRASREIAFAVAPGETMVVTGASGSGKSSLLNAVAAALSGKATVVFADDYVFTGTVADNIRLADPAATDRDIEELLQAMLLEGIAPGTEIGVAGRDLSGGEQRRLHLGRALAAHPELLMVDEPTAGLDVDTARCVLAAMRRLAPGAVFVLAMHEAHADVNSWATVSLD